MGIFFELEQKQLRWYQLLLFALLLTDLTSSEISSIDRFDRLYFSASSTDFLKLNFITSLFSISNNSLKINLSFLSPNLLNSILL